MLGQCARFAESKSLLGNIFQECHNMMMMFGYFMMWSEEDCMMVRCCGLCELCAENKHEL